MTDKQIPSLLILQGNHSMSTTSNSDESIASKQAEDELHAEWKLFEDNITKFLSEDTSKIEDPQSEEDYERLARDAEDTRKLIDHVERLQKLLGNLADKKDDK